VIASGDPRGPSRLLMVRTRPEVIGVELVEATAGKAQLTCGRADVQVAGTELSQNVADPRRGTTMNQLLPLLRLYLFIRAAYPNWGTLSPRPPGIFRFPHRLRQGLAGRWIPPPDLPCV
jgi:hypothetical protein